MVNVRILTLEEQENQTLRSLLRQWLAQNELLAYERQQLRADTIKALSGEQQEGKT